MNQATRKPHLQAVAMSSVYEMYHSNLRHAKKCPEDIANMEATSPENYALIITGLYVEDITNVGYDITLYADLHAAMNEAYAELKAEVDDGCEP